MLSFKGSHFPKDVVLFAVFFYVRYGVSYRDLEDIIEERGVHVDHATLNRWVVRYSPAIAAKAKARKRPVCSSWRMDETYSAPRPNREGIRLECIEKGGMEDLPVPCCEGA